MSDKQYEKIRFMINPKGYWQRFPYREHEDVYELGQSSERRERFDKVYEIQYGSSALEKLSCEDRKRSMETSPLSIGNVIVGGDHFAIYRVTGF